VISIQRKRTVFQCNEGKKKKSGEERGLYTHSIKCQEIEGWKSADGMADVFSKIDNSA
jgi:uncharacterized protein YjhX (UPF0386 family)